MNNIKNKCFKFKRTFEKLNLNLTIIRKDDLIKKHNNLVFDALIKIIGENVSL